MVQHARGDFEVNVAPVADAEGSAASGRMALDKTFSGPLSGKSRGNMWTVNTEVKGSAGYVAIERFEGALEGKSGGFVLMHQGTMRAGGEFKLAIVIVPDSGSGELRGISGTMEIHVAPGGAHRYVLDYEFRG